MEFRLITDIEKQLPKVIEFNNEELKQELAISLEKYNSLVLTEDCIKDGKADKATLNKLRTAIEDRRKEIKKQFLEPYNDFEVKVKEIVSMIDQPIKAIDVQIKTFENKAKEEKRQLITEYFNDGVGDLAELLPLEKIWDDRWLNATFSLTAAKKEIDLVISNVTKGLDTISKLKSEFEAEVKDCYLNTFDIGQALEKNIALIERKKKLEEYQKQLQQQTQQPQPIEEVKPAIIIQSQPVQKEVEVKVEEVFVINFRVAATLERLRLLKEFMKNNNITFGKVE
jgi:hypothetical protein